ncbi:MAG: hypothetical protein M3548_11755 [Actinomycetota bacterium]|nr:hypothetical protein [Actinomycetota bacterium]
MRRSAVLPRGGAPAAALRAIEETIDRAWADLCAQHDIVGGADETALAEIVLQNPAEFDWRVVDAAFDLMSCVDCGHGLGAGPVDCVSCRVADGNRYLGREVDRADVPWGNEHGLRVATAVARNRHRHTPRARCGYELCLPDLLTGRLPTTAQAQAAKALINRLDDRQLELVTELDEIESSPVIDG